MKLLQAIKKGLNLLPKESVDKVTEEVGESLKNRRVIKTKYKALIIIVIALLLAFGFIPKEMFGEILEELI